MTPVLPGPGLKSQELGCRAGLPQGDRSSAAVTCRRLEAGAKPELKPTHPRVDVDI